jgi:hypothetical protein
MQPICYSIMKQSLSRALMEDPNPFNDSVPDDDPLPEDDPTRQAPVEEPPKKQPQ